MTNRTNRIDSTHKTNSKHRTIKQLGKYSNNIPTRTNGANGINREKHQLTKINNIQLDQ